MPETKVVRSPIQLGNVVRVVMSLNSPDWTGRIAGVTDTEILLVDHDRGEGYGPVISVYRRHILAVAESIVPV
jgi:hypothetical protein